MNSSILATPAIRQLAPLLVLAAVGGAASASADDAAGHVSYHQEIRPIFQARCHGCHQPAKAMGEYVMTARESFLAGGETGEVAITPGDPDESYLVSLITPHDGEAEMPRKGEPLSEAEVALVRRWIAEGAVDDSPPSTREIYNADNPPRYSRPPVITSLDFSPDGKLLAVAGFHEVLLHRADGTGLVARLIGLSERIESVRFSPDGAKLAVTGGLPGRTGELQVWDVAAEELLLSLPATYDTIYGASWSPDGQAVAFGCADNTVRVVDAESGDQLFFQGSHNDWVFDTAFSVDGDHLVSVGRDMTAKLSELETERFIDNITSVTPGALKGGIASVVRHPLRNEVLFGGADGIPKIYQMHRTTKRVIGDDANLLWQFPPLPGRVFSVAFSRDARRIVAGSSLDGVGTVRVYSMAPAPRIPDQIRTILHKPTHTRSERERTKLQSHFAKHITSAADVTISSGGIYAVAVHPDNQRVAAAGTDGHVYFIDADSGEQTGSLLPVDVSDDVVTLAGSVDGGGANDRSDTVDDTSSLSASATSAGLTADSIASLAVEPRAIRFASSADAVQLVVTATLTNGSMADVTRYVDRQVSADFFRVTPFGRVEPLSDGKGELILSLGNHSAKIAVEAAHIADPLHADYIRDVTPVLSRAGCNNGVCHGAKDGKNGFKLSLRGYDPIMDVRSFTDDLSSRRVNLASPDQSLMLLKSTGAVPHEGAQVIQPSSAYYKIIRSWIGDGAKLHADTPRVTKIEVYPTNPVINDLSGQQQMRIVASYADGFTRDVTSEAFIESGNTEIADAVPGRPGLIRAIRRGEAPVLVRYEGNYVGTTVTVMGDRAGFVWREPPANNPIDTFVAAKLRRTKTLSSPLCDDYEFVRRVHLDLTGMPPTSDTVRNFVDDARDSRWKRDELIDTLLASDAFIDHWTNKWADLLQVNGRFLGRKGATALRDWIRDNISRNVPYDQFAHSILIASGSNKTNPPASYYKILRTPEDTMENTTHLFLATRFNCNKCHDHPFERWTQDQYYEMAAFFARVGRQEDPVSGGKTIGKTAVEEGKPLWEVISDNSEGEVIHQRTGVVTPPKFPYEISKSIDADTSRRARLAAWMTSPQNPYFATSYVNRIWGYLTGTGLIEPLDDIRAGNPPTNPELLQWLTDQFIKSDFDVRQLMRTICRSRTYQLSIETNEWNEDDAINYSHAKARRLPAEVLYDAIYHATGTTSAFPGVAPGTRASALPDAEIRLEDGFLANLGRPPRQSACECERSNQLQLGPIMALVTGPTVGRAVSGTENTLARLVDQIEDDRELIDELFMQILNRPPTQDEVEAALEVARNMDQEHARLVTVLEAYEIEAAKTLAEKEAHRTQQLGNARAALVAYEEEMAPKRAAREKRRTDKIDELQREIREHEHRLLADLPAWEKMQRDGTVWTSLDPRYFVLNSELTARRQEDLSFLVTGDSLSSDYRLATRSPLPAITGVRLDILADERLPSRGPGKDNDGGFLLTEVQLESRQLPQGDAARVRRWDFANDTEGWQWTGETDPIAEDGVLRVAVDEGNGARLQTPLTVPAGSFALEMVTKLPESMMMTLAWTTAENPRFNGDEEYVSRQGFVYRDGEWGRYRIYFTSEQDLTGLSLLHHESQKDVFIDSISLLRIEQPATYTKYALQNPQADFSAADHDITQTIDDDLDDASGWQIDPETGLNHVAIFETKEDISGADRWLQVALLQRSPAANRAIGRFRVSVTSSTRPLSFGVPQDISSILATDQGQRTKDQVQRLREHYLSENKRLARQRILLAETEKPLPPDEGLVARKSEIARLERPTPPDAKLERMRRHVKLSAEQLGRRRLTAAQDIAWALINSPAFLYNH